DVFEQLFEDRVKAARADIFRRFVDARGVGRDFLKSVLGKGQLDAFGVKKRLILLNKSVFGLFQDADEILFGERFQFDADREAALELGNEVAWLRNVERASCDKQDVIGTDESVAGVDRGALDNRQNVALHAFAAHIGTVACLASGDFVDFVKEHD